MNENPNITHEARIAAMPTLQFYRNGKIVAEIIGADENKLRPIIETLQ